MLQKIILCTFIIFFNTNAIAIDSYQATYGPSKIVAYTAVYPNFKQSAKLPANEDLKQITVIVASTKEIKINAAKKFFETAPAFKGKEITVSGVKAASNIAEQPIGLENAILGAQNRIKNAKILEKATDENKATTYYVAIENFFSELKPKIKPTDHAIVIIESPDGKQYTYLSEGVEVDPKIYKEVVTPRNLAADGTGTKTSIGDILAAIYKINSADWFALVTGKKYTREEQILTAFKFAS